MLDSIKQIFDDVYFVFTVINTINKVELFDKLPTYLKTDSKLIYLDKLQYLNVLKYAIELDEDVYETFIEELGILNPSDLNNIDFEDIDLNNLQTLLDDLTENQLKNVQNILDNITYDTFKDFLRYQISGEDWQNFYFLIKCFELEFDNNDMIVFTKLFPMDKRIKLEALGIWWIFNIIESNTCLKEYINASDFILQAVIECNIKMDLYITKLNICIEIDDQKDQDKIKNSLLLCNGIYCYRVQFYKIYDSYLKNHKNLNKKYLNSEFLKNTRNEIKNILYINLIKDKKFKEDYRTKLFIEKILMIEL